MTKKTIAQRRAFTVDAIQDDMSVNKSCWLQHGTDKEKLGKSIDACADSYVSDEPGEYAPLTIAQRKSLIAEAIENYNEYIQN